MPRRLAFLAIPLLAAVGVAVLPSAPRAAAADRGDDGDGGGRSAAVAPTTHAPLTPDAAAARMPVAFEANRGQAPDGWDFLVRAHGYRAFVRSGEILFSFAGAGLRMTHDGARGVAPDVQGFETQGRVNYLIGNDASRWRTGVPVTSGASYHDAIPGASWTADGDGRSMRMAWAVEGAVEPRFHLSGSSALRVERDGSLHASMPTGEATFTAPVAWQERSGVRRAVTAAFDLGEDGAVRVALGERDPSRTTFVDPTVNFVTYFGGSLDDTIVGVAVDASGGTFLGGHSKSTGLPTSSGAYATAHVNDGTKNDLFVVKFDSTGRSFVWCTYVGGNASDDCLSVGVNTSGQPVLIGNSNSTNFPTTNGVIGKTNASGVTLGAMVNVNPSGTGLAACSYFPLSALVGGALTPDDHVVLLGKDELHRVMGDFTRSPDASGSFTLTTEWTRRITPTTHNGSESTTLVGVAAGQLNVAVAYGVSNDTTFTTTSGAFQTKPTTGGSKDVLLVEYDVSGALVWSTFMGGSGDDAVVAVAVDPARRPVVVGATNSGDFPVTTDGHQQTKNSGYDAFVTRIGADGRLLHDSTFLGGKGDDRATVAACHASGATYVGGTTTSDNFPLKDAPQGSYAGGTNGDAFVAVFDSAARLATSSYMGGTGDDAVTGIAVRPDSTAVIVGTTTSTDLPKTNAFQEQPAGAIDGWYVQVSDPLVGTIDAPRVLSTQADVPNWTVGLPYAVGLIATDGRPAYAWTVTGGALPPGTALDPATGTISGTLSSTGNYAFDVTVTDDYSIRGYASYSMTVFPAPIVTTAAVPDVTRATPFDFQLTWSFGTIGPAGPAFTLDSGALPDGLDLGSSGRITGTPTTVGPPSTFTVLLTDDVGATATKTYTVTVHEPPTVDDATLDPWTENRAWSHTFTAQDGTPPLAWSLVTGSLPIGGGIDPVSGKIQGTTKSAGTYHFTLRAQDARGAGSDHAFELVVNSFPEIVTTNLPPAAVGRQYAAHLIGSGGTAPSAWTIDAGLLPDGLTLTESSGAVDGAPTKPGTAYLVMNYTDASGAAAKKAVYLDTGAALDVRSKKASFKFTVGIGTPTRTVRWMELVAGTVLNVTVKGGGLKKETPSLHLYRSDASEVDLAGFVKATSKGVTLKKFPVPTTGRWFLAVESAADFRGKMSISTAIAPAAKWSQTVTVDAAAAPVEALFAALPGARVSVSVAPAKRSAARPVITDVLDGTGKSLLSSGKLATKGKTATFTLKKPAKGGDYRVLLSAAAGFPGDVVWTVKLTTPPKYGFSLKDVPAGDEEP